MSPAQLVEEGAEAYQQGDYRAAISFWEQALTVYPSGALNERAFINENLARTTQQIGESAIALDYWEAAATAYQTVGNLRQFGRMLTEQAQLYISQGQYQRAAALLCGAAPPESVPEYVQVGNARIRQTLPNERIDEQVIEQALALSEATPGATPGATSETAVENAVRDNRESQTNERQAQLCMGGAFAIAKEANDVRGQAAAIGSLAEAKRLKGRYETAEILLEVGLTYVREHRLSQYEAPMLVSLGNLYMRRLRVALRRAESAELIGVNAEIAGQLQESARDYSKAALDTLNQAIAAAVATDDAVAELSAQVSLLRLQQLQSLSIASTQQRLGQLIEQRPPSRETVYAAIALAKSYQITKGDFSCQLSDNQMVKQGLEQDSSVESWLSVAYDLAERIQDSRAASFVLGEQGHVAECQGHIGNAIYLTQQAQLSAGPALASADSLYLWEWQIGRLYQKRGELALATMAYQQAIATLETIRTDILTADRELQFDFRDTVDPIYRQYIELQLAALSHRFLSNSSVSIGDAAAQPVIALPKAQAEQTLQALDGLRLAELQNFFGDDCVLTPTANTSTNTDKPLLANDSHTAVISSVVLSNQVVLIVNVPDEPTRAIRIADLESLRQNTQAFQRDLKRTRHLVYDSSASELLYQQLFKHLQPALKDADIHTLIFIQDGFLRNIPMAALYDGERYLVEKYAIATTPSLALTAAPAARISTPRTLAVGLSEATTTASGQKFAKLDAVPNELEAVAAQLPNSTVLLNQDFTKATLASALTESPYAILHLATHGQFSTIPEETFVVTGTANAGSADTLTFGELEALIRSASPSTEPIDLITLTACETAAGDDRATLGLAGVAIRAGARSAIASLWKLDDEVAAMLIEQFYHYLKQPQISKAQALQLAQIDAIKQAPRANPGTWAPLLLVGSWQ